MVMFSILINGASFGFFHSTRRLMQRDQLLLYIFVIGMKALSSLINRAMFGGFLLSCRVRGEEGVHITHLLLAMILLVLREDSQDHMAYLT